MESADDNQNIQAQQKTLFNFQGRYPNEIIFLLAKTKSKLAS